MYTGNHYPVSQILAWTRHQLYGLVAITSVPTLLYTLADWHGLAVSWVPIALIGTSAAFIAGFRNNATYARLWEARQIYGSILNHSRTWGLMVRDLIRPTEHFTETEATAAHRQLIHRHIAWLTALRYQLRQPRPWEMMEKKINKDFKARYYQVDEHSRDIATALAPWLSTEEQQRILTASNQATRLLAIQGEEIGRLRDLGALEANAHVALEQQIGLLYTYQGACERIKNFPYPRQFATLSLLFIRLFVYAMPFGLLGELAKHGPNAVWLTIPFGVIIGWIFVLLDAMGQSSENPFEGSANDVPITALSRTAEIDLREMLGEQPLPAPLSPINHILM